MPSAVVETDGTFSVGYSYDSPYGQLWVTSDILPFLQMTGRYVSITGIPGFTNVPGEYGSGYVSRPAWLYTRLTNNSGFFSCHFFIA